MAKQVLKKSAPKNNVLLIGQATTDQLKTWEKDYGKGGIIFVRKGGRIGYFKHPDFKDIDAYHAIKSKTVSTTDVWKQLTVLLWLGGCKELIESPRHLGSVFTALLEAMGDEEVELGNL